MGQFEIVMRKNGEGEEGGGGAFIASLLDEEFDGDPLSDFELPWC